MRRLKVDRATGFLHLGIDTLDDLWALRNLIEPGDLVTASTTRTGEAADDKIRSEKAEKKPMTLGIRAEQVDWHDFDDHLRVLGTIEQGPQDIGRHHTLILRDGPRSDVKIHKRDGRLLRWHLDQVDEAVAASKAPQAILLAIDDSEAQFGQLAAYGLRMLGALGAGGQGKRFAQKDAAAAKKQFYAEVLKSLEALRQNPSIALLVVGPGWWREEFIAYAEEKKPALVAGARTEGTSQAGSAGLHEALKRGIVAQVAQDHRVQEETALVEQVLTRIAKGEGLVAYGPAEVVNAIQAGAAEEVLLTDEAVRERRHPGVVEAADDAHSHVRIIATSHDAGAQLQRMGGVAALLRFALG